jgi:hypothetical protein
LTFGLKEDLVSASQFVGHEISSLTGRAGGKGKRGGNVNGKADGMVVDGGDTGLEGETGSVVGGEAIVTGAGAWVGSGQIFSSPPYLFLDHIELISWW